MLGKEAVALADAWRPNGIGAEEKARWLSQMDRRAFKRTTMRCMTGRKKRCPFIPRKGKKPLLAPAPG